jgi:aflatoxin B1 aldehyde reductase
MTIDKPGAFHPTSPPPIFQPKFTPPGVEQTRIHTLPAASALLDVFQSHSHNEIDTARVYGGGSSEEYLGNLDWQKRGLVMGTKYYPHFGRVPGATTTHSASDLRKYLLESLSALKAEKIDLWYLHAPDRTTSFEETFKAIDDLHKEGLFNRFGISNYMAWEVAYINEICIKNNWIRPTVYQGVYNAIHRTVDTELFPALRHYGMAFYVFSPLAGGYLTSRYTREVMKGEQVEQGSRFDGKTGQGKSYRQRYWNESMFSALDVIREAAGKHGFTEAEVALRWLMHHSKLDAKFGDKVIIGASSEKHLEHNLLDFEKGPLPEDVVQALDEAWKIAKGLAYPYYH